MSSNTTLSGIKNSSEMDGFMLDYHPVLITISVIICITNCLVVTLFLTQASLRSSANYFLFSLAISDLAEGLFGIPVNIACEMVLSWNTCLSSYTVNRFIAVSTVYHILWITLEKYSAIIHPLKHKAQFNESKVKNICFCIWMLSVALSVIELSWLTQHDNPRKQYTDDMERKVMIYNIFIFIAVFFLPMAIMAFAYMSIFLQILRQHSHEFLRKHTKREERAISWLHARAPRNTKSALLFFVILLVFILAWFWWFFVIIFYSVFDHSYPSDNVVKFLTALRFITSFVNPILYTFFKRDFNKAVRKLINRSRLTPAVQQRSLLTPVISHSVSERTKEPPSRASKSHAKGNEGVSSN